MRNNFMELPISTRDGTFIAHYSAKGLAEIDWPKVGRVSSRAASGRRRDDESQISPASKELIRDSSRRLLQNKIRGWHRLTEVALKKILAGDEPKKFPPLDLAGTEFQKSVWRAMQKIPLGKTKSYGEIASAIGKPRAVRAVGGACGANPIPALVPCHRVLAANHKLGGFGGGLDWKRKLLAYEGVKSKI
jgi:O-6-methylguanine DNA methyltransferase